MFERISLAWLALRHGQKAVQITPAWSIGRAQTLPVDYHTLAADGYSRNELVFACIRYLARSAGAARLRVLVAEGKDAPPNHPLVQLLKRPNPEMGTADFLEAVVIMLNIAGDCYWEKERVRGGVRALWPMRPDRIMVQQGRYGPEAYQYRIGTDAPVVYRPTDVIHFQYYNPLDDYFGLSPLAVCARAADADNERTDFTRAFFINSAVPQGLLKTKSKLTQAESERIAERWYERYGGLQNWHKVAVLDADAEYQRLGLTQQEMSFPDLTALSETRIAMVFGVPPILIGAKVGLDRGTYSNYAQARVAFWQDTMVPMLRKYQDTLNIALGAEYSCEIEFDLSDVTALQEDRTAQFSRAAQGVSGGWLTVNEARAEVGLEAVEAGDRFLRQLTITEVPADGQRLLGDGSSETPAQSEQITETPAQGDDETTPAKSVKVITPAIELKMASRTDQIARAHELPFLREARRLFREERDQLSAILGPGKGRQRTHLTKTLPVGALEYLAQRPAAWSLRFQPLIREVLMEEAEELAASFGISFDVHNPKVQEFIEQYSYKFAQKINQTTIDGLQALVEEAEQLGWSAAELQRHLRELYDGWSELRAEMIARSESLRALNQGTLLAYKLDGIPYKKWLAAIDGRECPWCRAMDGKIIPIDDLYFSVGDTYTVTGSDGEVHSMQVDYEDVTAGNLHTSCRCTLVPAWSL